MISHKFSTNPIKPLICTTCGGMKITPAHGYDMAPAIALHVDDALLSSAHDEFDPFKGHCPLWMYPMSFVLMTKEVVGESEMDYELRRI